MQVIQSVNEMQSIAMGMRVKGKLIGFVPTMGALHEGHLALVDVAKDQADFVVVSIFVNPTQFGPNEDFERYPRTFEGDLARCEERGVDVVFAPTKDDIYPDGFSTYITEEKLSRNLCGASRPGHFRGVTTIVAILFNIVRPDIAVFGQKDAQQAAIIRKMTRDLHLPVDIVTVPIQREPDGLAMSSRNRYLEPTQREDATAIYRSLQAGKNLVDRGVRNVDRVIAEVSYQLSHSRRIRVIYVSIVDPDTMENQREIVPGHSLLAVAVWIDQVRLIDNILL